MLEIDKAGVIIDINENYLEMLGYAREEVVGKNYDAFAKAEGSFQQLLSNLDEAGVRTG